MRSKMKAQKREAFKNMSMREKKSHGKNESIKSKTN